MNRAKEGVTRRRFIGGGAGALPIALSSSAFSFSLAPPFRGRVIDAHMHLEAYGTYWDGLIDEIIEHYDYAGIERGVVFTCWTPSRESNDRTHMACQKYPDRFIPFGHVRTEDLDWESELERIGRLGWKGIKLHQNEISRGPDLQEKTYQVVKKASDCGIHIMLIHLARIEMVRELSTAIPEVIWLLPHMGSYRNSEEMKLYCELAREMPNVYLDTSGAEYYQFGKQFEWAGCDKIIYASDGFWYSPFVEKAKIEILQLPTPFRTPRLTDGELGMILGGNLERILQM
jgi:predicted TIM-barrel fold metal-dependent hydrolase